uniref:Transcriptional regulator, MarR family n=1 Tax=Aureimonas frigidaquae TaxID=424757 RepID=A0A0P0Z133_9HYPH|nr:transcriptional regulator, MarR family [Aureimonas frigidaquae]
MASKGSQNPETAGRSFARASDRLMRVLGRKLLPHAIAPGEWLVLCELVDAGRMMPSTLAERLNMSRGGVSRLVDRMVERGLIDRTADTNDRRAHWLSVSPKGLDSMPGIEVAVAEGEEQFFGRLSQTERRNLHTILSRLADSDRR